MFSVVPLIQLFFIARLNHAVAQVRYVFMLNQSRTMILVNPNNCLIQIMQTRTETGRFQTFSADQFLISNLPKKVK